ncbi:putative septum site-determining protein MinC [Roseibium aquae]|uniref:Probable septum site-determining protein MinC n=1 Tax=Roseibium aquae TaxID=1323746 RepID=A0A916TJW8_9HYPH|nr:putative septum site-determining protein MinC [Roseibium aquae]
MKFKGKSFIAIVLTPDAPLDAWFGEIDRIIARSPGFFIDRPIILDVRGQKIAIEDLETILDGMAQRTIRVMGIDGVAGSRLKPGMPPSFSGGRLTSDVSVPDAPAGDVENGASGDGADQPAPRKKAGSGVAEPLDGKTALAGERASGESFGSGSSIVISEPVRSGQRIMHPGGDVTVIGSVSSGAEVIAGGSIHIYGALRGRALAGVAGDENARIFCGKLDAELVSINGLYKVADDFEDAWMNTPAQIRFEDETLVFEKLG